MRLVLVLTATALAAQPLAAQTAGPALSLKDPQRFITALKDMGYNPRDVLPGDKSIDVIFTYQGFDYDLSIAGCKAGKDCGYIFLSTSYSDVPDPPADWLAKMNREFDMIKVRKTDNGLLRMTSAHVVEGLPRSSLPLILDYFGGDVGGIGDEAKAAGLVKKK